MNEHGLALPLRNEKPRDCGITILIDNGIPLNLFKDTIDSAALMLILSNSAGGHRWFRAIWKKK